MTSPADPPASAVGAPTIDPSHRDPADLQPAITYQLQDRVWVHPPQVKSWRPGLIEGVASAAVRVSYLTAGRGQAVDTVTPIYVMPRAEHVPDIDGHDQP